MGLKHTQEEQRALSAVMAEPQVEKAREQPEQQRGGLKFYLSANPSKLTFESLQEVLYDGIPQGHKAPLNNLCEPYNTLKARYIQLDKPMRNVFAGFFRGIRLWFLSCRIHFAKQAVLKGVNQLLRDEDPQHDGPTASNSSLVIVSALQSLEPRVAQQVQEDEGSFVGDICDGFCPGQGSGLDPDLGYDPEDEQPKKPENESFCDDILRDPFFSDCGSDGYDSGCEASTAAACACG